MEDGVGLSGPGNGQYRRSLLDLINRLRNTGSVAPFAPHDQSTDPFAL